MEEWSGIILEFGGGEVRNRGLAGPWWQTGSPWRAGPDAGPGPGSKLYRFRVRCAGQAAIGFPARAIPANGSRVSGPVSTRLNFVLRRIHEAAD
jgi:hypothetical protein